MRILFCAGMTNRLTLRKCLKRNTTEKEDGGRAPFQNDAPNPAFDQYCTMGLFTPSRGLPRPALFSMQNNRGIIIIHITHRNVTEASQRIFSGPQKGRNGICPTFCHHRAPNSITSASWHPWQWYGSLDSQGLSDSWERVIVCPHWYLPQETHADEEGKTSLPLCCLCRQACGFQRTAYFMVPRTVSTLSPLGNCNSKKTETCRLSQLVSEKTQEPPGSHSEHVRYNSTIACNM